MALVEWFAPFAQEYVHHSSNGIGYVTNAMWVVKTEMSRYVWLCVCVRAVHTRTLVDAYTRYCTFSRTHIQHWIRCKIINGMSTQCICTCANTHKRRKFFDVCCVCVNIAWCVLSFSPIHLKLNARVDFYKKNIFVVKCRLSIVAQ